MDSLRKEIEQEMKRARLDKGRLYDLILKIVDNVGTGGVGPQGPAGPTGPAGPACECKCVSKEVPTKAPTKASTTKKAPAKKKVTV
jgi:hypothetical protein